jgi:hypothetical protein
MWATASASAVAGTAAFVALYRLRDDPLPGLGAAYRTAAYLQPLPFAAAALLAVCLRRQPAAMGFVLAAVVGCGGYGWWSLSGLEEVRRVRTSRSVAGRWGTSCRTSRAKPGRRKPSSGRRWRPA